MGYWLLRVDLRKDRELCASIAHRDVDGWWYDARDCPDCKGTGVESTR